MRAVLVLAILVTATPAWAQPTWWVTLGAQLGIDPAKPGEGRGTETGAVVGLGVHVLRLGPVLFGVEGEGSANRVEDKLETPDEKVDVWRGRLGIRGTWWEEYDEPLLVPYVRAGAVYRADRQARRDDEGVGWYFGIGLDLRLSEHWALGGFVTYEYVFLREQTKGLLLGVGLTFSY